MAEDRGPQVAAVAISFLVLSWVAVSLRVFVRSFMVKNFGMDDWLAVATLVSEFIFSHAMGFGTWISGTRFFKVQSRFGRCEMWDSTRLTALVDSTG
jgi:hypothetical protein